jgi:hypothetical protein
MMPGRDTGRSTKGRLDRNRAWFSSFVSVVHGALVGDVEQRTTPRVGLW